MLRTKKKQLNLKPNRVLDKRSSRGMLYENEELRLRTIHINDEVEKGQTDIKKLRKENEYLKREIWSLRDECEKLEDMIKKVYNGNGEHPPEMPKYQPRVRKMSTFSGKWDPSSRRGSAMSFSNYSYYDENESEDHNNEEEENEDDNLSYDNSSLQCTPTPTHAPTKNPFLKQDSQDVPEENDFPEEDEDPHQDDSAVEEDLQKIGFYPSPPLHQTWQMHEPELEAVTEESETSNNTSMNLLDTTLATNNNSSEPLDPNNLSDIRFIDSRSTSAGSEVPTLRDPNNEYTLTPFFNPTIEITPASTPTPTNTNGSSANNQRTESRDSTSREGSPPHPSDIQELGCVTLIPKKYQVTSELKILSDRILPGGHSPSPGSSSPSLSSPSGTVYENEMGGERKILTGEGKQIEASPLLSAPRSDDNPHSFSVSPRASPDIQSLVIHRDREHYRPSPNPSPSSHSRGIRTLSFLSDSLGRSGGKVSPLCKSEPSLNRLQFSSSGQTKTYTDEHSEHLERSYNQFLGEPPLVPIGFNGFDPSVEMCGRGGEMTQADFLHSIHGWNSVDKNLVVGYLDGGLNSLGELNAQEIIDELEVQFDPTLERIAGVRMLTLPGSTPRRLFISLRTAVGVKLLLDKGFTLRGTKVRLVDASHSGTGSVVVILSGLPASFPDSALISVLNQFGQVVAPLERRVYKGVDISERLARMHLFRNLPGQTLSIAGYEVLAKVLSPGDGEWNNNINYSQHMEHRSTDAPIKPMRTAPGFVNFRPAPSLRPISTAGPSLGTPSGSSIPRPHKLITRSATLESTPTALTPTHFSLGPTAAAINKRKMSICSAIMDTSAGNSGASNAPPSPGIQPKSALLGNPKKPLSRLPRSSPGSLTPASPVHQQDTLVAIEATGPKPLLRSMSFEPRRISMFSKGTTEGSQLSLSDSQIQCQGGGNGRQSIGGRQRFFQQHGQLSGGSNSSHFRSLDKKESLPWCGCWGNGCI